MTISDIRHATAEKCPHFFSRDTLRFFGQRMSSFRVWKGKSGAFYIAAPSFWIERETGRPKLMGISFRQFTGDDLKLFADLPKFHDMEDAREWVKTNG